MCGFSNGATVDVFCVNLLGNTLAQTEDVLRRWEKFFKNLPNASKSAIHLKLEKP